MDGYMMFTQKLEVHVMREAEVHPALFKGAPVLRVMYIGKV